MFNPSPSGIAICAVLFLLFFLLCNRLLRRRMPQPKQRLISAAIAAALVSGGLYISAVIAVLNLLGTSYPLRPFEQARWLAEPTRRFDMIDDLIKSNRLPGKDTTALLQLLGSPDIRRPRQWEYYAGESQRGFGIAIHYLTIDLAADWVTAVVHGRSED